MLFPDKSDFKFNAVCVAVEIGLFKSLVLLTFANPTMDCVMPDTLPVKVGLLSGALASNAVCVAVEIGLFKSLVLLTFGKPTIACDMPVTVPVIDIVEPFILVRVADEPIVKLPLDVKFFAKLTAFDADCA